jgi:hypothetical protein
MEVAILQTRLSIPRVPGRNNDRDLDGVARLQGHVRTVTGH